MSGTLSFFLSPGRSGTQWIGARLAASFGDLALVEHEPIHANYVPRRVLGDPDYAAHIARSPALAAQLAHIDSVVAAGRDYIDAGWCVWAWMPYFIARYPGRVRLVHFTRHPVRFAYSMESHGFYRPDVRDDGYTRDAQLEPTDPGVRYPEYRERWGGMTPFEKCLYQWLELNAFVLAVHREHPQVPYLHLRMEDLTADNTAAWRGLLAFLGLPVERVLADPARTARVDRFHFYVDRVADPKLAATHPQVVALAREFGYPRLEVSREEVARRYARPRLRAAGRLVARAILGTAYRPLRRRMLEWQQARSAARAGR
jgi:hypothetical protein